jgi:hypothetical protein
MRDGDTPVLAQWLAHGSQDLDLIEWEPDLSSQTRAVWRMRDGRIPAEVNGPDASAGCCFAAELDTM